MKTIEPQTALEAHNLIKQYCETEFKETRFIEKIKLGEYGRQGDIYLVSIDDFDKNLYTLRTNGDRQLTPGNTQGSRHLVDEGVEIWDLKTPSRPVKTPRGYMLKGAVIRSKDFFAQPHPEHADFNYHGGTYQVCHQVDLRTMKRVID